MVQPDFKVSDTQFLYDAVQQIRNGRRFLKWTYAHGYFTKLSSDQRRLFEFHQAQLEGTLERLSDITENTDWSTYLDEDCLTRRPIYDVRTKWIDLTNVVRDFFKHLQQAIDQGTLFN